MVAPELRDAVAPELAKRLGGQHEGKHRLRDDAHGWHRGDVGAFLERHGLSLVRTSDGLEPGRSNWRAASWLRRRGKPPVDMPPSMPPAKDVSLLYSRVSGSKKIESCLMIPAAGRRRGLRRSRPLSRLDAHHRLGDEAVEFAVPVDMAPRPTGRRRRRFRRCLRGSPLLGGILDLSDHGRLGRWIQAPHRRRVHRRKLAWQGANPAGVSAPPIWTTWLKIATPIWPGEPLHMNRPPLEQPSPGRSALEHVTGVVKSVLLHAGKIRVARPRLCEPARGMPGLGDISASHLGHSAFAISIATVTQCPSMADATENGDLVGLEAAGGALARSRSCGGQARQRSRPQRSVARREVLDHSTSARPWDSPAVRRRSTCLA